MACYWGFGTQANRIVYIVCFVFGFIGVVLIIAGAVGGSVNTAPNSSGDDVSCFSGYRDCVDVTKNQNGCADLYDSLCQLRTWLGLLIAGIVIFIVGGLVPMSFCCCCSKKPESEQPVAMAHATGQYVPAAPMPHGGYSQPVQGVPYYQPAQLPHTMPYYPEPGQPLGGGGGAAPGGVSQGVPVMAVPFDPNAPPSKA
mmetsp:Transcript_27103/g.80378  ORF Transcript_27103/g.80378 Transcript_27103/m.80378 type:complete len:198 (-) Transcript_27103:873-1466(-)